MPVARRLLIVAALLGVAQLQSATLQQLSMNDLIAKSTAIVRGTIRVRTPPFPAR